MVQRSPISTACNLSSVSATRPVDGQPIGSTVADAAGGVSMSVLAGATIAVGDVVIINAGVAKPITTALAIAGSAVGVAEVAIPSGSYGFVLVRGTSSCKVLASCAKDVNLFTTATAGSLDDAITNGRVLGLRLTENATDAGTYACQIDDSAKIDPNSALDAEITAAINALSLGTASQSDVEDFADADQGAAADAAFARPVILVADDLDVIGANAKVKRFVAPIAGTITKIYSVLNSVLATGDATITAAIAGTPVTNGVITITQAASAAGDIDSATPTAANTVAAGQLITLTVGGTNDQASSTANVQLEITPAALA